MRINELIAIKLIKAIHGNSDAQWGQVVEDYWKVLEALDNHA